MVGQVFGLPVFDAAAGYSIRLTFADIF